MARGPGSPAPRYPPAFPRCHRLLRPKLRPPWPLPAPWCFSHGQTLCWFAYREITPICLDWRSQRRSALVPPLPPAASSYKFQTPQYSFLPLSLLLIFAIESSSPVLPKSRYLRSYRQPRRLSPRLLFSLLPNGLVLSTLP